MSIGIFIAYSIILLSINEAGHVYKQIFYIKHYDAVIGFLVNLERSLKQPASFFIWNKNDKLPLK